MVGDHPEDAIDGPRTAEQDDPVHPAGAEHDPAGDGAAGGELPPIPPGYLGILNRRTGTRPTPGDPLYQALAEILAEHRNTSINTAIGAIRTAMGPLIASRKQADRRRGAVYGEVNALLKREFGVKGPVDGSTWAAGKPLIGLRELYDLYEGICQICRSHIPFEQATRDHRIPLDELGRKIGHRLWNIQLACFECSNGKANSAPRTGAQPLIIVVRDGRYVLVPDDGRPLPAPRGTKQ